MKKQCGVRDPVWDRACTWDPGHKPEELHQDNSVLGDRITWGPAYLVKAYEEERDKRL